MLPKICELSACVYVAAEVMEMKKIAYSGIEGAFAHVVARRLLQIPATPASIPLL